jgi:hypothetical protein
MHIYTGNLSIADPGYPELDEKRKILVTGYSEVAGK